MSLRRLVGRSWPSRVAERRHIRRRLQVSREVADLCDRRVVRGPFAGTVLPALLPDTSAKLLGSYEVELQPAFEQLVAHGYAVVVNVGCSDGYYAAGLVRRLPGAHGFAFDVDAAHRAAARETAAANDVAVEVDGACTAAQLAELCGAGEVLVVCDCEGCERDLIAPEITGRATVVVELHAGTEDLPARFGEAYRVSTIGSAPRHAADYPELARLRRPKDRDLAVFERVVPQDWAIIQPVRGGRSR